jgi:hypothetical protein
MPQTPELPSYGLHRVLTVGELQDILAQFPRDYPLACHNMGGHIQVTTLEDTLEVAYEDYL